MDDESLTPKPEDTGTEPESAAPESPVTSQAPPAPPAPPAPQYAPPPAPPAPAPQYSPPPTAGPATGAAEKNKIVAGVLGILLGGLGIHKFYLGYTKEGVIMLAGNLLWIVGLGWVPSLIGLIEGVMYLFKSDAEFEATYVVGNKPWF